METRRYSLIGRFLRLWFVLFLSFVLMKLAFNLAVLKWIDLRPVAFLELLVLPLGQSVVFAAITRRRRLDDTSR